MQIDRKKLLGYRLYGAFYTFFRLFPVKRDRAYFIMTHDSSDEGNCGVMRAYMKDQGFICDSLTRHEASSAGFIIKSAYRLARSCFIFADNAFLPLAFLKLRKGSSFVQLWHGTGTIKKFGQDVNTGKLKELEARCGDNISHLIVSSEATRKIYSGCFNVPTERTFITGLPRSDVFFDPGFAEKARKQFEKDYPLIKKKKLILYAPTFRDDVENEEEQTEKIKELAERFIREMPDNTVLGLRLHPYVADRVKAGVSYGDRLLDLSHFKGLNTLLGATDMLITDYSSIIFEYSLLQRPMLFYAYDLDRFENSDRGFYRDYRSYVPGPVVTDCTALINATSTLVGVCSTVVDSFVKNSFAFRDGVASERIYKLISNKDARHSDHN